MFFSVLFRKDFHYWLSSDLLLLSRKVVVFPAVEPLLFAEVCEQIEKAGD